MATLPRAVQRQLEAADVLLAGANQVTPDEPTTPATIELAAPAEPTPLQQEPPAQPAPATVKPEPSEDTWKTRYQSLQGLMNTRINELQGQNKGLADKLQSMLTRLDTLAKQPETPPQASVPDPKDVDDFGQDLVEMVQRQVRSTLGTLTKKVDQIVTDVEKRLAQVEQALQGTSQAVSMTAEEMFFGKLARSVPEWEQINADERFLEWLGEVDPVYGEPRQAALNAAQQALNADRAAAVFNAFKATLPQVPKTDPLAKQVSPKAAASAPTAPTEKPVVTQAQIQKFYLDVAQHKYRGREDEVQRLEAAINNAIAEGRVR